MLCNIVLEYQEILDNRCIDLSNRILALPLDNSVTHSTIVNLCSALLSTDTQSLRGNFKSVDEYKGAIKLLEWIQAHIELPSLSSN